jgi:DNA-binding NarL/FixJ family response regulator
MDTKILIVEDDELLAATFQRFLTRAGYSVDIADDYSGGKALLTTGSYSAVFMDINLRGKQTGMDLLKDVREINIATPVVIITGSPEIATAAAAVRNAAFDYLCKPIEKEQLLQVAQAAVNLKRCNDETERQRKSMENALRNVRDSIATANLDVQHSVSDLLVPSDSHQASALSLREQQILTMLGQGESNADIAAALTISIRTVETYFARIIDKIGLDGMKALRRHAIRNLK